MGREVERTGRGSDYKVRDVNPWTGARGKARLVDVKSSSTAKRSPLQKKKGAKKVVRGASVLLRAEVSMRIDMNPTSLRRSAQVWASNTTALRPLYRFRVICAGILRLIRSLILVWLGCGQFAEGFLASRLDLGREIKGRSVDELSILRLEPPQLGRLREPQQGYSD